MKLTTILAAAGSMLMATFASAATCTYNGSWDTTPSSADDDIVITSGTLTWDTSLPATVKSWTQSGGDVTFATTFADATGATVLESVNVSSNVSFTGGKWTHLANTNKKQFRLYVKVGGDMTMGADAVITAEGLGYTSMQKVNEQKDGGTQGGSYGGHGAVATAKANWTYGSYSAPEDLGNAGAWSTCYAGGAIRLDITGKLTLNGSIGANGALPALVSGNRYYSGSGGSVYLNVGSITGTGTLSADAAGVLITGAGGRIAVIVHDEGADFANFDLKTQASAKSSKTDDNNVGGCGTIYGETPSDKAGEGWLILKGTGTAPTGVKYNLGWADPFTYEYTTLHFAKISILGKTKLIVNEGNTLDLTGTTLESPDAGYGIMVNGGKLKTSAEGAFRLTGSVFCNVASTIDSADVIIDEGGVLAGREKITIPGDLTIKSGGKMETDVASATPTHALYLDIAGNLTIEEGGTIDVSGQGYTAPNSPSGQYKDSSGGSYAGKGLTSGLLVNAAPTYGSIINPLDCGSGGFCGAASPTSGGGVVRLEIAGALTVDGSIVANGTYAQYYAGSGGSINVKAVSIAGKGLVQARGGDANYTTSASGGRIAVRLTGEGKTFEDFTGTWDVRAGTKPSANIKRGGAGTIYLQTLAEGENGGTLIVDGGDANAPAVAETSLGGDIEGLEFGNIIIRNKGNLVLAPNATLIVKGNFQNEATFVAGVGSTVRFAGAGESVISGDNTFVNLGCATDGKTIKFAAGSKQTVTGAMTIAGGDEKITLCSTETGSVWNLDTSSGSATLSGIKIGDCNSTAAITITDGESLGGNSDNITVQGAVTPETITWSGKIDGSWSTEGNWDVRVPTKVDTVVIPAGTRTATLAANVKVASLSVAGTLNVADKGIVVTGDMTVSGALIASGAAPIDVGGNLNISGTFTAGSSIVTLNGASAQSVNCASGVSLASLVVASSAANFATDITAASLTLGAGTFAFAKDITVAATKFNVTGDADAKNAVLKPANEGDTWKLKVSASTVSGATVSGSDASASVMIVPKNSVDAGNNTNWLFNDTRIHWTGSADSDFANSANWKGGKVPTATDDVVIEGATAAVISSETAVGSLTLGLGATLTVNTNLTCNGALLVEGEGTLIANKPIDVKGNMTVLDDATVTHDVNVGVEEYKIEILVGGSAYFATTAKVNVKGKGYKFAGVYRGPGAGAAKGDSWTGASHGGRGFHGATPSPICYGSVFDPVNIGSAGGWTGNGGGAVKLSVGGLLTLDGAVDADGGDGSADDSYSGTHYSSSGGSVNIQASSLAGSGSIRACGGTVVGTSGGLCGGGGRIAVVLTDERATLDGFKDSIMAYGGFRGRDSNGSAGTIYTKVGSQNGLIKLAQNSLYINSTTDGVRHELTDFPAEASDNVSAKTAVTEIEVQPNCVLNLLADTKIADLRVLAKSTSDQLDGKIKLNGHTLRVRSRKPKDTCLFDDSRVDADGGTIVWQTSFTLIVR